MTQELWTSREVVSLTGITPRQLQWWDERSVVKPEREGHRRVYSINQLTEVAVICQLRHKGFSLQGVRKVMRFLAHEFGKGLAEIVERDSDIHLLTDGVHLYLETSAQQIVDILKNARQPMFLVCVTDQVKRLSAATERKPARSETSAAARKARAV